MQVNRALICHCWCNLLSNGEREYWKMSFLAVTVTSNRTIIHPLLLFLTYSTFKGAHHRARFMAYAVYYLKIPLFSKRFEMPIKELYCVKRTADHIAIYCSLLTLKALLESRLASCSPAGDKVSAANESVQDTGYISCCYLGLIGTTSSMVPN